MNCEVYIVNADRTVAKHGSIVVDETKAGKAIRAARDELSQRFDVRAVNIKEDRKTLIAYVQAKPEAVKLKERGKPVVHEGPVGKGREVNRFAKGKRR